MSYGSMATPGLTLGPLFLVPPTWVWQQMLPQHAGDRLVQHLSGVTKCPFQADA